MGKVASGAQQRPKAERSGGVGWLLWLTESGVFRYFILLCIVLNAVALGVDAHFGQHHPWRTYTAGADYIFLGIFTVELSLKFLAQGPKAYVRDGWNLFDVTVVGLSYAATTPAISALRTIRVFRLVSAIPAMRRVVGALLGALPGIMATFVLLLVVFYIGAVMATMLFPGEEGFADLGQSALTLFALTQFDGWGETIARLQPRYPYAWIFIMGFTIVGAFAVLNLFIGVIVEAVQAAPSKDIGEIKEGVGEMQDDMTGVHQAQESSAQMQQRILAELASLRAEVASLRGAPPTPAE